jgi:hypothetical protein
MWNVKTKVIPVIIMANGTISKSLRHYLSNIPGKHEIKKLQKTAILFTALMLWEVVMSKYITYFTGQNNITCSTNCKYRTAATLYILETWFASGT